MGLATGRDLHIDRMLSNIAINFRPTGMVADMIAPIVTVEKETDLYPVFLQSEMFSLENALRSRGAEARKITRSVSSAGYNAKNYALARDLYIEDIANMDAAIQMEMGIGATHHITDMLSLGWEKRVIDTVTSSTNVSSIFLPNSAWNAPVAANQGDPMSQVMQVKEQIQSTTGYSPNGIMIGWRAWAYMRRNINMRNLIYGTNNGRGFVTRQQVQDLFEVERFNVQASFFNVGNEAQVSSFQSPFHDKVLVYYAPQAPSRETPSFMYTFRWQAPGLPQPFVVERHPYDSRRKVETIEAGYYQDEVVTGKAFGALISGVGSGQANGI